MGLLGYHRRVFLGDRVDILIEIIHDGYIERGKWEENIRVVSKIVKLKRLCKNT